MRTVLICHSEDQLNRIGTARWLASFSELAGIVEIQEGKSAVWKRVRREIRRSGWFGFFDVAAFRIYYRLFLAAADRVAEQELLERLCRRFPELPGSIRVHQTPTPNGAETEQFVASCRPDLIVARCKVLLREAIFSQPRLGTFVMHPGICPEYRNAHGCFWALANNDLANVGLTLLQIDRGVDTGPVFGYYRYPFDELAESHILIQHRSGFENLDAIAEKFREIERGNAVPIDTGGRKGAVWGQPWLSRYFHWKRQARKRRRAA